MPWMGSAKAGGEGGWWEPCGWSRACALDPDKYRIMCFNNLGLRAMGAADPGVEGFRTDREIGAEQPGYRPRDPVGTGQALDPEDLHLTTGGLRWEGW